MTPKKPKEKPAKRKPRPPSMRYITRMKDNLWRVMVPTGEKRPPYEYVTDKQHGGKAKALKAAKQLRDKLAAEQKIPTPNGRRNRMAYNRSDPRNTTGAVGLALFIIDTPNRQEAHWAATYTDRRTGKQKRVRRSIRRHGYKNAWKQVARARANHTGQKINDTPPSPTRKLIAWARKNDVDLTN